MDSTIRVARAALHMWEEPVISGTRGSGTVFFSGCPLRCVFCQNHQIAIGNVGKEISVERLVEIFFELKEQGANNINLVTPSHYVPQLVRALEQAKNQRLDIPIVYNTGSYETVESLKMLDGLIDIYLPDCKYYAPEISVRYARAEDYFETADKAIEEMVRQTGAPVFVRESDAHTQVSDWEMYEDALMRRGVIVRHLLLPGCVEDSKNIIKYLYEKFGNQIFISIMNQYTPLKNAENYPELMRKVTEEEYDEIVDYAIDLGVEQGFIQEGDTAEESFIPEFDCNGIVR